MTEPLYDYPCSETFRQHELWWQGEGLYSEPREHFPIEHTPPAPAQDFYLLGRMAYLQHQVESLEKGYHTHKKKESERFTIKE